MRALFEKMFESSHFNTGIMITPFSVAHIVYLVLIFGGIFTAWYVLRNKDTAAKQRVLRFLVYMVALSYVSVFLFTILFTVVLTPTSYRFISARCFVR